MSNQDWKLELYIDGLLCPLTMTFRDKAAAVQMRIDIGIAKANSDPPEAGFWADHDGTEFSFRLSQLTAMKLYRVIS